MLENGERFRFHEESLDRSAEGFEWSFPMDFVSNENASFGFFK